MEHVSHGAIRLVIQDCKSYKGCALYEAGTHSRTHIKTRSTPLAHTEALGYRRQAARHSKAGLGEQISLGP